MMLFHFMIIESCFIFVNICMDAENIDVYVYGYLNTRSAIDFLLEFYTSAVELV